MLWEFGEMTRVHSREESAGQEDFRFGHERLAEGPQKSGGVRR